VSQALYRRWRPRAFAEVVGQNHVTQTLHNALRNSRIVHAYLFSGPRGTGKTSTARILAKAVNCLTEGDKKPCNECSMCRAIDEGRAIDLIEIDAASNTGVDDIRDLRERISFSPGEARYKFYIVDEVHMLSGSAFNALLKTLEEPPPHAILVLATTEPHKIPATVLSRCQRFDFRPIPLGDMMDRLRKIAAEERLEVEDPALELIARQSTGSMRDAESLLDQLSSYAEGQITLHLVQTMLGTVSSQAVKELVNALVTGDLAAGLTHIGQAIADGADARQLNKELLEYLEGLLLIMTTNQGPSYVTEEQQTAMVEQAKKFTPDTLVATIRLFNKATLDLRATSQPRLPLELAFVEAVLSGRRERESFHRHPAALDKKSPPEPTADRKTTTGDGDGPSPEPSAAQANDKSKPAALRERQASPQPRGQDVTLASLQENWIQVLAAIKTRNMHIEAVLKDCQLAMVEEDVVTVSARYPFHKEKLEDHRSRQLVEQVLSTITGRPCRLRCILTTEESKKEPKSSNKVQAAAEDPLIRVALEEMGAEIGDVQ
jgi:DNA polymerase-3 subunit gamma/tau